MKAPSGVELTIALYDGIIRFMHNAIDAVERRDVEGRRAAVKRAMDIVVHLQATLDKDVGGKPAEALSDFYVAMFALMLQGSQANSRKKFEQVIANVRNVREAWKQIAAGGESNQSTPDQQRAWNPLKRQKQMLCGCLTPKRAQPAAGQRRSTCDREFFFQLLLLVEAGVVAVQRQQFFVAAHFDNPAVIEHRDLVGVAHGRDSMRDQDRGGSGRVVAQTAQDALFGVGVDAGQRIVQNENRRPAQQGARNGQSAASVRLIASRRARRPWFQSPAEILQTPAGCARPRPLRAGLRRWRLARRRPGSREWFR